MFVDDKCEISAVLSFCASGDDCNDVVDPIECRVGYDNVNTDSGSGPANVT